MFRFCFSTLYVYVSSSTRSARDRWLDIAPFCAEVRCNNRQQIRERISFHGAICKCSVFKMSETTYVKRINLFTWPFVHKPVYRQGDKVESRGRQASQRKICRQQAVEAGVLCVCVCVWRVPDPVDRLYGWLPSVLNLKMGLSRWFEAHGAKQAVRCAPQTGSVLHRGSSRHELFTVRWNWKSWKIERLCAVIFDTDVRCV